MKICKCDRCGAIFEPTFDVNNFYSKVIQVGEETFNLLEPEAEITASYDICESCYKDFVRWLGRGKLKASEK